MTENVIEWAESCIGRKLTDAEKEIVRIECEISERLNVGSVKELKKIGIEIEGMSMTEIKEYAQGQPIEPCGETRVYVHKDVLKYLELYQEIGTISQLKALKEERDEYFLKIQAYRAIGTVEEFKALKEKAEPKNWIAEEVYDFDVIWQCPACKEYQVLMDGTPKDNEYNFCPKCGQALAEEKSD